MSRNPVFQICGFMFAMLTVANSFAQQPLRTDPTAIRLAMDGDCVVSLVEMKAYVNGEERFESTYRGLRYQFLSEDEKMVFDANPETFAIAFSGIDIVATYGLDGPLVAKTKIFGAGRNSHRHENRTYHFADEKNFRLFVKQPNEYIFRAKQALYLQAEQKRGKTLAELYPTR